MAFYGKVYGKELDNCGEEIQALYHGSAATFVIVVIIILCINVFLGCHKFFEGLKADIDFLIFINFGAYRRDKGFKLGG